MESKNYSKKDFPEEVLQAPRLMSAIELDTSNRCARLKPHAFVLN